jgi:hypothetical protein
MPLRALHKASRNADHNSEAQGALRMLCELSQLLLKNARRIRRQQGGDLLQVIGNRRRRSEES